MILAGDIGGTKTLLALFTEQRGGRLRKHREASYASDAFESFQAMARAFLAEGEERVRRCAVGVAGPVIGGRSHVVNVEWPVDAERIARALKLPAVHLLNDLEALAWGLPLLASRQVRSLTPGLRARPGNAALLAPGTGLGMAILFDDGGRLRPSASEGGHLHFAARDELEAELMLFMRRRLGGRVSVERIVAGPGFSAIHEFLVESGRGTRTPEMSRRLATGDANAAVSDAGLSGADPTAERAVDLFVSMLGAVAGDLALIAKASGGVWIGGGIPPRILPKLAGSETFLRAFRDKGRLSPFVERIPVKVILEPKAGLLGAAWCAARGPLPQRPAARARG
jgi:glucokinase